MPLNNTWETIVEADTPLAVHDLEVILNEGEPLTLGKYRPALYDQVLEYWNKAQVQQMLERATELADALTKKDEAKITRMTQQIGGVNQKLRLSRAVLEGKKLYLALSSTNYMDFIGTNEQARVNPDFWQQLTNAGLEDYADADRYFANPLAICAVMYGLNSGAEDSKDLYVPVGMRSSKVMIYPNMYHIFGGVISADKDRQKLDLGHHLRLEFREEIGLTDEEMGLPQFYGICRHVNSRIPEVICGLPVLVQQKELEQRWKEHAPGKFEHRKLSFLGKKELPTFLQENAATMVPSGAAALTYFLKYHG